MKRLHLNMLRTIGLTLILTASAAATGDIGIFELILISESGFNATAEALEANLVESDFVLHAKHDLYVPSGVQKARFYVLTSPEYMKAAEKEKPNTISAQILRLAVYEYGAGKQVQVNMANPVAHAMIYYSGSPRYMKLIQAAEGVVQKIRSVASGIPGRAVSEQSEPKRSEAAYNGFNGDGPAKMMAKFRNWEGSQSVIIKTKASKFEAVLAHVEKAIIESKDAGVDNTDGWSLLTKIPVREDAVYFGITNLYTEDRTTSINSDFRKRGKSTDAPYPGVDHAAAFPMEVIVYEDGNNAKAVQYGQMWRMQLYYWDSGYAAFAKYTLIPGKISGSIEDLFKE